MSPGTGPCSGADGEQPSRPPLPGDPDWDGEAEVARLVADIDAGLTPVPDETDTPPQTWFSLAGTSDPADVDVTGFAQGGPLNTRPPDAVLAAVAEMAAGPAIVKALTDSQVLGLAAAGRRLAARGAWVQQAAVAEFAARRTEPDRKKATACGFTAFAPDELAHDLVITGAAAEEAMTRARDATARLRACTTLLRDGLISAFQLLIITDATAFLTDAGAAEADLLLAAAAARLTPQALRIMCTRTVMMIDPAAAKRRKDSAAKHARVTRFAEDSGNAALCGRELPPAGVLASSQHIDGCARTLRDGGIPGTLDQLRALAFLDLTRGQDPLTRLIPGSTSQDADAGQHGTGQDGNAAPGTPPAGGLLDVDDGWDEDDSATIYHAHPGHDGPGADDPDGDGNQDQDSPGGDDTNGAGPGQPGWSGNDTEAGSPGQPGPSQDEASGAGPGDGNDDDGHDGHAGEDPGNGDSSSDDGLDSGHGPGGPSGPRGPSGPGGPGGPSGPRGPGGPVSPQPPAPAPVKAAITLLVPAGTLLGWSAAPGQIPGFGLLDPPTTRDMTTAAAAHPGTRWCVTVVGPDGTAAAHGCAPGPHPWTPGQHPPPGPDPPAPAEQAAQITALLQRLRIQLSPIAHGSCDHRHHSDRYVISRHLKHLIKARAATCTAPGCSRPSAEADADHTIAWPDGPSCECNLGAPCRYHHRNKQAPGWRLEQPEPGVMTWHTPSGRTHTTYPTRYVI